MSEPKFTGVWIPAGVFQTTTVSITAKVVYGVVEALDNDEGCFASNAYLSRHLGLGERQIRNILSELETACLIRRVEIEGKRVIRTVEKVALTSALAEAQTTKTEGAAKKCRGGRKNIATGGGKILPPYNKEDNKEDITTPTPSSEDDIPWTQGLPFGSKEFSVAWASWIDYRKEMKKPLKPTTVKAQWKELTKWGERKSIEAIEQSIKNGWQGLFEPRQNFAGYGKKPLSASDHNNGF